MIEDFTDRLLRDVARLDPYAAVADSGEPDADGLTDYSPDGHQARADLAATALRQLESVPATGPLHAHLTERLRTRIDLHDAGEDLRELHTAATGPLQLIRRCVEAAVPGRDTAGAAHEDGWARVAARQAAIPAALDGYARSLRLAADRGHRPARRQVDLAIQRCHDWADEDLTLAQRYGDGPHRASLLAAAQSAQKAYHQLALILKEDLGPRARAEEAFGPQRYALWVRAFLGAEPDLRELYKWGWDEFTAIEAQLVAEAGGNVPEALDRLDRPDAPGVLPSRAAFGAWLQELLDATTERLHGTHFDIPAPLRRIESRVTVSAGTGYARPSRDLTRPGRVTWFLPGSQTNFPTWRAYSVVYHEGVPGHHLQVGAEACRGGPGQRLNLLGGLSASQEGWALYAERFMDEIGHYEQPGARLGYLFSQLLRAARVVLDIGLHLRLWTPDAALRLLRERCHQGVYAPLELARYLGRPGQALTYKVGERVWLAGRASFRGDFHRRALDVGSLGLDSLTRTLAADPPYAS
ncbi:DUF885 domain-containing protein [Actinoplanes sp. NPDC020271]|uniref:DUF885 domain-containing protein n=1 Tax=Actinoplanes sp. NPDC020271 TaxID=3363896 RepID=UPI003788D134